MTASPRSPTSPSSSTLAEGWRPPLGRGYLSGPTRARHQKRQGRGHNEQRRHIAVQMAHMLRVGERLDAHDATVHDTRPYCEPDEAAMRERVSRCDDQEHPERRIDAEDHLQIVRRTRVPSPAGWPNDGERVDADGKYQTHGD